MLEAEAPTAYAANAPLSIFPFISNQVEYFSVINEILQHKVEDSVSGRRLLVTGKTGGSGANLPGV